MELKWITEIQFFHLTEAVSIDRASGEEGVEGLGTPLNLTQGFGLGQRQTAFVAHVK